MAWSLELDTIKQGAATARSDSDPGADRFPVLSYMFLLGRENPHSSI